MKPISFFRIFLSFGLAALAAGAVFGQGSAFNFQGRLNDGANPANGRYDLEFRLFTALAGGTQIGATLARPNTILINGVFSTTLDFGAAAFNNPNSVFIETGVRPNGSPNAYTILGPRQQITAVPFAIRATNATFADLATNATNSINAFTATSATTATNAANAEKLGNILPSGYARINAVNPGDFLATGNLSLGGGPGSNGNLSMDGNLSMAGNLSMNGNARQSVNANGLIKAMLVIRSGPLAVVRCYNGITDSSTGTCGFIISNPLEGVFRINFGFPVSNRFVAVTAEYAATVSTNNSGANYRFFDDTSVEVFTFAAGNSEDTGRRNFTLIMF
jgi:hypothetical protein